MTYRNYKHLRIKDNVVVLASINPNPGMQRAIRRNLHFSAGQGLFVIDGDVSRKFYITTTYIRHRDWTDNLDRLVRCHGLGYLFSYWFAYENYNECAGLEYIRENGLINLPGEADEPGIYSHIRVLLPAFESEHRVVLDLIKERNT